MTSNTTTVAKNTARNINLVTFDDVPERLVFAAASCNVRKAETLHWGKAAGQMFRVDLVEPTLLLYIFLAHPTCFWHFCFPFVKHWRVPHLSAATSRAGFVAIVVTADISCIVLSVSVNKLHMPSCSVKLVIVIKPVPKAFFFSHNSHPLVPRAPNISKPVHFSLIYCHTNLASVSLLSHQRHDFTRQRDAVAEHSTLNSKLVERPPIACQCGLCKSVQWLNGWNEGPPQTLNTQA